MLVVGDVNSTIAPALTATKAKVQVAHVEAGLRSYDRAVPEEVNRLITDAVADYLFVTEESGEVNLPKKGVPKEKICFVGNGTIDSLESSHRLWEKSTVLEQMGLAKSSYGVVTLHQPSNVDHIPTLEGLVESLVKVAQRCPPHLSCSSADDSGTRTFGAVLDIIAFWCRPEPEGWNSLCRSSRLSRLHGPRLKREDRPDRFWRLAGGDHRSGSALPDPERQYRTSRYRNAWNYPRDWCCVDKNCL